MKQGGKTSSPQGLTGASCQGVITTKKKRDQPHGDVYIQSTCSVMFI